MNPALALKERMESNLTENRTSSCHDKSKRPTLLIAAVDPEIRRSLSELLKTLDIDAIWTYGVEDAKRVLQENNVAVCLCGFWLQDGTSRELICHVRREQLYTPVIILSAAQCPDEYKEYLSAINTGALDFLCYPYQQADLEEMLESAIEGHSPSVRR